MLTLQCRPFPHCQDVVQILSYFQAAEPCKCRLTDLGLSVAQCGHKISKNWHV